MKALEIMVTNECNWKCDYCLVDIHNKDYNINMKDILESIDNGIDSITLSGGEPGLISRIDLIKIITKCKIHNIKIDMNTNGLFLEKYQDLIESSNIFGKILYHCVENLENHKKIKKYNIKNIEEIKYVIVLDIKENIENTEKDLLFFTEQLKDVKCKIIPNLKNLKIKEFMKICMKITKNLKDFEIDLKDIAEELNRI